MSADWPPAPRRASSAPEQPRGPQTLPGGLRLGAAAEAGLRAKGGPPPQGEGLQQRASGRESSIVPLRGGS